MHLGYRHSMRFSMREKQILALLQQGFTNKVIAIHLKLSPHTVRDHISCMLQRTKVPGRAALAALSKQILTEGPRDSTWPNCRRQSARRSSDPLHL